MNSLYRKPAVRMLAGVLALLVLPGCSHAVEPISPMLPECVGGFKLSVPGPVNFAVTKWDVLLDVDARGRIAFSDGEMPTHAVFAFGDTRIDIAAASSPDDFAQLRLDAAEQVKQEKIGLVSRGKKPIADSFKPYDPGDPNAFAWRSVGGIKLFFKKGNHIYRYDARADESMTAAVSEAKGLLSNMRSRKPHEVPADYGICYPHSFLKTAENPKYWAGVAMRLVDYPEIEILLEDVETLPVGHPNRLPDSISPIRFFLEKGLTKKFTKVDYDWQLTPFKMGGMSGKAAFANVTRDEKQEDFVFLAFAPGEAGKPVPSRNLLLYVSRNAARAKGAPVSEAKFRQIAEAIAKSVAPLR